MGGLFSDVVSDKYSVSMMGSSPPETILDPEPPEADEALNDALAKPPEVRRDRVVAVVARWPRHLGAWARLGDLAKDPVDAYAAYRVAYHRGLDRLRQNGWRGSGYVRWAEVNNRGFLRAVFGLARVAGEIAEWDEQERCQLFLRQLDPDWPPTDLS